MRIVVKAAWSRFLDEVRICRAEQCDKKTLVKRIMKYDRPQWVSYDASLSADYCLSIGCRASNVAYDDAVLQGVRPVERPVISCNAPAL